MPDRVFVAIELPQPVRDLLSRATQALLSVDRAWADEKLVQPALMHVTLAFLGPVKDIALLGLLERLRHAAARDEPFCLCLSGVRPVPSARRATMVWATMAGEVERAGGLAADMARAAGLPQEVRPFRAHVTLARARRPRHVAPAGIAAAEGVLSGTGQVPDGSVSVRSATVFSSTLGHGGPIYERLAVLRLEGGPAAPGDD